MPNCWAAFEDRRAQRHLDRVAVDDDVDLLAERLGVFDALRPSRPRWLAGARVGMASSHADPQLSFMSHATCSGHRLIRGRGFRRWKSSTIDRNALGADWPSPHLEANCMVSPSAQSSLQVVPSSTSPLEHVRRLRATSGCPRGRECTGRTTRRRRTPGNSRRRRACRAGAEDDDRAAGGDVFVGDGAVELRRRARTGPAAPPTCTALASSPPTSFSIRPP